MKHSITFKILVILSLVIITISVASLYLYSQSDNKLISDIRAYNFNRAMKALDSRQEERLHLNKELMQDTINMIAKNSSVFLLNFNKEGLKKSLLFDIQKEGIRAIVVWDDALNENFLTAIKINGSIAFKETIPDDFKQFIKINKVINNTADGVTEQIGNITLYYDEFLIINQIATLKSNTKSDIDNFDKAIDKRLNESRLIKLIIEVGTLFTILFLIAILLMRFVNKPLKILESGLNEFFLFLQNKNSQIKEIALYSGDEFGSMAKSLNENISVSACLHAEIHELNTNLEKRIQQKTEKVTSLLDNADQGFLSFGKDLIIDNEYSKQCTAIFKQDISGSNIADLLYGDSHKKGFFIQTLQALLEETNQLKIKTIISLLQHEFIINKKAIDVKYKIISDEKFMLIFTDVTAKKILQKKIDKERNILKMIVAVVSDTDEFFELCDEYNELVTSRQKLIEMEKTSLHNANELYRTIHTFKGLFAQKEMNYIVAQLHQLESRLSETIASQDYSNEQLQDLMAKTDLEQWLHKDMDIIHNILGDDIFHKKGEITIQEETITQIEKKILGMAKKHHDLEGCDAIVKDIRSIKSKPLSTFFNSFPKLIDQLSQRLNKSVYPLKIIADNEIKSNDSIKPFVKSLIHVFRNAVDHGIESMDERLALDKDEVGTISCSINQTETNVHIIIADDGAGLNLDKIKVKAVQLGINTDGFSQTEIENLIFHDQFSTKEEANQISGRGVGMASVKKELEQLNGQVNIKSQKNIGTTIEFIIPIED
ncbi:MAG: hypothetical protein HQL46_06555 [Gammaproteobacteria bacterium]|nr:hypothetical protein [Gammaproteobacteria bacterium]